MSSPPNPYAAPRIEDPAAALVAAVVVDDAGHHIQYEIGLKDYLAFNEYHQQKSPAARGNFRRAWFLRAVTLAVIGFLACVLLRYAAPNLFPVMEVVVIGLLFAGWCLYPLQYRAAIRRLVEQHYRDTNNDALFGLRKLSITPEYVIISTPLSQTVARWRAIREVDVQREALYLFQSGLTSIIVPRRAFASEAEFQRFVEAAVRFHSAADKPSGR